METFREGRCSPTLKERLDELSQCHLYNRITVELQNQHKIVQTKIADAELLRKKIKSYARPSDVPETDILQLKDLLSDSKRLKNSVTDVIQQGNDYLRHDKDPLLDFDLAALVNHWLELKRIVKDLGHDAQALNGFRSEVSLYYTTKHNSPVSSPIKQRIPLGEKRYIALNTDPSKSLLKEKGRKWFAKLSIPYRVFIKSKVKLHYRGSRNASRDTSFTDSDLHTLTDCSSSVNSSFNTSFPLSRQQQSLDNSRLAEILREVRARIPNDNDNEDDNRYDKSGGDDGVDDDDDDIDKENTINSHPIDFTDYETDSSSVGIYGDSSTAATVVTNLSQQKQNKATITSKTFNNNNTTMKL